MEGEIIEYQQIDPKWNNSYCVPYFCPSSGEFYARDALSMEKIPGSACENMQKLRQKVKKYRSPGV